MLLKLEELSSAVRKERSLALGCIVDTNIIFAASFPLDIHNEWAEKIFCELRDLDIPVFTNVNIRSEFIELNRRVLIPEGLVAFYGDMQGDLNSEAEQKLKSLKTLTDNALKEGRPFKLSDSEIKKFRSILSNIPFSEDMNGWGYFCKEYFHPYISTVWEEAIEDLKIQFLGTRAIETREHFNSDPSWSDMMNILGKTGIGTSDAMIINHFLHSKLRLIVTTDIDVKKTVLGLVRQDKDVLAP